MNFIVACDIVTALVNKVSSIVTKTENNLILRLSCHSHLRLFRQDLPVFIRQRQTDKQIKSQIDQRIDRRMDG